MIFELKEKKDKVLENMYEQSMKELGDFFKIDCKKKRPLIVIMKDRKSINQYLGYETKPWVVGWLDKSRIHLLDRSNYEKESSHKYSDKKYFSLLKHELCHLFFEIYSKRRTYGQFIWLSEGVSVFLASQINKPLNKFNKFINQYSKWDGNAYKESGHAVKLLHDSFGKQKLLKLIKSLSLVKTKKDFNNNFKAIYGQSPTYTFFNNLLKNKTAKDKQV